MPVQTDACITGGGAFCGGDWTYCAFQLDEPILFLAHINIKELAMVIRSARRWGHLWTGYKIMFNSDNLATVGMINKGTTPSSPAFALLEELCNLSIFYNFGVESVFVPGHLNILTDSISRFHEPGQMARFVTCLNNYYQPVPPGFWLDRHMSIDSMHFLYPQIRQWRHLYGSWMEKFNISDPSTWQNPPGELTRHKNVPIDTFVS